jgi:hypothetical protein
MTDDNLQHRLLREPARFVEDVRVTANGRLLARPGRLQRMLALERKEGAER